MALDKTAIANLALLELGAEQITDIGQNKTNALRCAAVIDAIIDEVTEAHPWRHAVRRANLAASGTAPLFGWGYAFPLPTDPWCLRPLFVGERRHGEGWTYEGRELLTNEPGPLQLVFIARTDIAFASAQFATTAGYRLAAQIAFAVTNTATRGKDMWAFYDRSLAAARSLNAQSAPPDESEFGRSDLLESRR